jgi:uncharacterized small protein (DUF1192 family)
MSDTQKVQVAPMAALTEALALSEFYRNRCLILANAVHEMTEAMQAQQAEIERLKAAMPQDDGSPTGSEPPAPPPSMKRIRPKAKTASAEPPSVQ